jgi:hypothetical protein
MTFKGSDSVVSFHLQVMYMSVWNLLVVVLIVIGKFLAQVAGQLDLRSLCLKLPVGRDKADMARYKGHMTCRF